MEEVKRHLEAALKILEPMRDAARADYDKPEKYRTLNKLTDEKTSEGERVSWHDFVIFHNMCKRIKTALYLANNPKEAGHEHG